MLYCRSGFECVVKQLWMVLYKPDCDSNDCKLPNEKATPSEVWLMRLHVGGLLIEYHSTRATVALGWVLAGWQLEESKKTHSRRSTAVGTCMQVDRTHVRLRTRACLRSRACARVKGVWSHVLLSIAYSFSCDSFDCVLYKNSQFAIKRILHSKLYRTVIFKYRCMRNRNVTFLYFVVNFYT